MRGCFFSLRGFDLCLSVRAPLSVSLLAVADGVARLYVSVFFPDGVFDLCVEVVCPCEDEEEVGEPVDVSEERGAYVALACEGHYVPFCAAAYGACHMRLC